MPAVDPEILHSSLLTGAGFRHAFFTRRGGHSGHPFDSLHFGANGHDPASLAANVRAAAAALGVDASRLYLVTQVHGRDVASVRGTEPRDDVLAREADVVLTAAVGVACGVKVADCVPVLVADRETGAVAAIHCGWQGTVAGVVGAGIAALRRELGHEGRLLAAIGPHIEVCCFEVGDDVASKLCASAPGHSVIDESRGPRPHVDLRKIVRAQLLASGVTDNAIDDVAGCTRCDEARFFSYRRDRENSGRLLSAIVARE
jgi:purine-nucleoside/S-methyl-5'-thioadenosine phosphorylase / adenosine deaminase